VTKLQDTALVPTLNPSPANVENMVSSW